MQKKFLLALALMIGLGTVSMAQSFNLGIKGGANLQKLDGTSFTQEFKFGYNLGAFAEIYLGNKIGIQPEVLWAQAAYKTGSNLGSLSPVLSDADVKLAYLQVPLLLNIRPVKFFTIQVGPQYSILINESKSVLQNGQDAFKSGDLSLLAGGQINLGGLKVGARYAAGLNNLSDVTNQSNWKSTGIQLYVALKIL